VFESISGEVYSIQHNEINFNSISKDLWIAMFNYWKFSVQFYRVFRQIVHFTQDIILPNRVRVRGMVFNATFNNISVISWRSVLLVEETREKHRPVASHWQTLSHYVVSSIPRPGRHDIAEILLKVALNTKNQIKLL
jgi:hypothetical protein